MNNKEKEWKATTKVENKPNENSDIMNLNDDGSFVPIEENEREPLTEEEKKEVRKKLFFLLVTIIVVLIGLLIVLIFNPFSSNSNNKNKDNNNNIVDEEDNKQEEGKTIFELEDGPIELENAEIRMLKNEITFLSNDFYENNTIEFYLKDSNDIKDLSDKNKLFLIAKTKEFESLIHQTEFTSTICDTNINIEKIKIDNILNKRFNSSVTNYEPFLYNVYSEGNYYKTIKFTLENDTYIGKCYELNTKIENLAQQNVISATKDNDKLYIDAKVVFIKEDGVYKDPSFNNPITKENQAFEQYIQHGNTYRYTYNITNNAYTLTNISLVK